jgi:hypothetical protein
VQFKLTKIRKNEGDKIFVFCELAKHVHDIKLRL